MKIPVHYYTEIDNLVTINDLLLNRNRYLANEGSRLYLVEVLA